MKKKFGLFIAVMAMLASITTTTAQAATENLDGGAAVTVEIDTPSAEGPRFETGETVTVSGTASVGLGDAIKDTDVVFVLDTSGSTDDLAGTDCDRDPAIVSSSSILECEKAAVLDLVEQAAAPASRVENAGVTFFPNLDEAGSLELTPVSGGIGPFQTTLDGVTDGRGGTPFDVGIDSALAILGDPSPSRTQAIIFLTDGDGNTNATSPINALVLAFTIAGDVGCTEGEVENDEIDAIIARATAGSCTNIPDLADLARVIQDTFDETNVPSFLDRVDVTVRQGEAIVETRDVITERTDGKPASLTFSADFDELEAGAYTICATATGSDGPPASSSVIAEDCVSITVEDPLPPGAVEVDCELAEGDCTATATDEGVATLDFAAPPGFDEEVVIVPTTEDCPVGDDCRTGFDVLFDKPGTNQVSTVTVTTENRVRFRDRLRAAVYIDGQRIRAQCSTGLLGRIRARWGIPEPIPCSTIRYVRGLRLQYFVKFDADPAFRFR